MGRGVAAPVSIVLRVPVWVRVFVRCDRHFRLSVSLVALARDHSRLVRSASRKAGYQLDTSGLPMLPRYCPISSAALPHSYPGNSTRPIGVTLRV